MTVCHTLNRVMYQVVIHILVDSIQLPDDRLGRTHHVREQYDVASRFVMHRLDDHAINTWLAVASQEAGDMYFRTGSIGAVMML